MLCQLPHWLAYNILRFCWKSGIGSLSVRPSLSLSAKCLYIIPAEPLFWISFFEVWIEVFDLRLFRNQRFLSVGNHNKLTENHYYFSVVVNSQGLAIINLGNITGS